MAACLWFLAILTVGHVLISDHHAEAAVQCTWIQTGKPAKPIGILIPGVTTIDACKDACQRTSDCLYFDWIDSFKLCYLPVQPSVVRYERNCEVSKTTTKPPLSKTTTKPPLSKTTTKPPPTTTTTEYICERKMDLAFIIDASSSICGASACMNWDFMLEFIRNLIKTQTVGPDNTRVAVITFANKAAVIFYLNTYKDMESLLRAVNDTKYTGGDTNTTGAFKLLMSDVFVLEHGDRPKVPNTVIIISDGSPTIDEDQLEETIAEVQKRMIKCLAVGVTTKINDHVLELMSHPPHRLNEDYFIAASYESLEVIRAALAKETCQA